MLFAISYSFFWKTASFLFASSTFNQFINYFNAHFKYFLIYETELYEIWNQLNYNFGVPGRSRQPRHGYATNLLHIYSSGALSIQFSTRHCSHKNGRALTFIVGESGGMSCPHFNLFGSSINDLEYLFRHLRFSCRHWLRWRWERRSRGVWGSRSTGCLDRRSGRVYLLIPGFVSLFHLACFHSKDAPRPPLICGTKN